MLDHERLDAYQCALQFSALAFQTLETLPRDHADLADRFCRATLSIPVNIAEGCREPAESDRSRYHAIARGSVMECGAILDILRVMGLVESDLVVESKALLVRIVAMLTKMGR